MDIEFELVIVKVYEDNTKLLSFVANGHDVIDGTLKLIVDENSSYYHLEEGDVMVLTRLSEMIP